MFCVKWKIGSRKIKGLSFDNELDRHSNWRLLFQFIGVCRRGQIESCLSYTEYPEGRFCCLSACEEVFERWCEKIMSEMTDFFI